MEYSELAKELIQYQFKLSKAPKDINLTDQSRGEMSVIAYLMEVEDGVAPSSLAKFAGVSTARMASVLNSLEKKGYITRSLNSKDRRKIIVHITDEGKVIGIKGRKKAIKRLSRLLSDLGEHDAKEHVRIMKKIYLLSLKHREEEENDA
ncbi:MarR family winged helix-turn-helix transcriptional regulator [Clostridium oceanicum]|uniref:Transcriptional regulator n=1 Tax=Clostridium oceanicum TaxID=1543 RepID=A0ABN1JLG9_9CLOT